MNNCISIIMPAYNSEKYIADAIKSVINQTYQAWELLAIDDGSIDNTGKIIDEFAKNDKRIKAIHINNHGVSFARNIGLDNAKGEWIAFLDSDDILPKSAIEKLFVASEGEDLVIGNYCEFPKGCRKTFFTNSKGINVVESIKKCEFVGTACGMIFNRKILFERFEENINFGEDTLFFYGQLKHCRKVSTIKDIVYQYRRESTSSLSHQKENIKASFVIKFCLTLKELLKNDCECYYSYAAHIITGYAIMIIKNDKIGKEKQYEMVKEIITSRCFGEIPIIGIKIKPRRRKLYTLLKTGDILLFERELKA